jgi:hypothetical protein
MEKLVYSIYGFWFWLTRKYRSAVYTEAATALAEAREYLWNDYATRASTVDRGWMLPEHLEALQVLDRHSALAARTSSRFESLTECTRFITEELAEMPAQNPVPATGLAVAESAPLPSAAKQTLPSFASLADFLTSDEAGAKSARTPILNWTSTASAKSRNLVTSHLEAKEMDAAA